jgi:hypothetical protein
LTDFAEPLWVMLGGAGLVLLIACANLGNLLLARTTARVREVAVRLALGAGRGRLVRQLLTESLCLAVAGGVLRPRLAFALRQALIHLLVDPIALPATLDRRVLLFVFVLTLAVGLLLGLLPALRTTKTPVASGLRDQGRGIAGSAAWLRIGRVVVVGQLALSLPLLVGAGMLARTLVNLQRADLGYPKDGVFTIRVDAQAAGYEPARQAQAFEDIAGAGPRHPRRPRRDLLEQRAVQRLGQRRRDQRRGLHAEGRRRSRIGYDAVGPGYFSTLGVPVMAGREITGQDRAGGAQVCVINETFARRFFAGAIRSACTSRSATPTSSTPTRSSASSRTRARTGCAARWSTASTRRRRSRPPASAPSASSSARVATARRCCRKCGACSSRPSREWRSRGQASSARPSTAGCRRTGWWRSCRSRSASSPRPGGDGTLRRPLLRSGAADAGARRPQGARGGARHADGADPARDRLAAGRRARRRRRARGRRGAVDRQPPLRLVGSRSVHVRGRHRRARRGRVRGDVAAAYRASRVDPLVALRQE